MEETGQTEQTQQPAFQDQYADRHSYCYGCGRLNERGLHLKSYWEGDEAVCRYTPRDYHMALPGYVYGGLIASLVDCHGVGTAAAARARAEGRAISGEPAIRFVTASLHVDYLRPTPMGPLELRARVRSMEGRRVTVEVTLHAAGHLRARGEVVAAEIPENFMVAK